MLNTSLHICKRDLIKAREIKSIYKSLWSKKVRYILVFNTVIIRFISNLEQNTWLVNKLKVFVVSVNYINGICS